ncbi:ComF family protein [Roseovarius pelagicus]|uniref:ComF family protein n=1 Tax=Roseovarius pelagicus TaxID=2980108 RepID=A0ABY6DGB6_9RHOB|nr:ComF family protein [Roseovarius pelagicus]UXX85159.1 ComF family protein [Roseovarius pelagicus]
MGAPLQSALRLIYPPRCTVCGCQVDSDFGLCGPCWRDTPFVAGMVCDDCGIPLMAGGDTEDVVRCDECMVLARPWAQGRAALQYEGNGRKLTLALKHGDRQDVVRPAALWMARAAGPLICERMLVAPVPLHWLRMLKRRYNQSALLAQAVAQELGLAYCPDLLVRPRATPSLGGLGREARFAAMRDAIAVHKRRRHRLAGRHVLLVDDVMTSGATLAAASEACLTAGAREVRILVLARAGKAP